MLNEITTLFIVIGAVTIITAGSVKPLLPAADDLCFLHL